MTIGEQCPSFNIYHSTRKPVGGECTQFVFILISGCNNFFMFFSITKPSFNQLTIRDLYMLINIQSWVSKLEKGILTCCRTTIHATE